MLPVVTSISQHHLNCFGSLLPLRRPRGFATILNMYHAVSNAIRTTTLSKNSYYTSLQIVPQSTFSFRNDLRQEERRSLLRTCLPRQRISIIAKFGPHSACFSFCDSLSMPISPAKSEQSCVSTLCCDKLMIHSHKELFCQRD